MAFLQKDSYKQLKLGFYLKGLRLSLAPWEVILGCRKDSLLIPFLTTTDILTEHCPQERVLDNQLPGSHKLYPLSFSYNYKLLAIMTGKIFKNSTAVQGRRPLPWKHPTDQHTNQSPSLPDCLSKYLNCSSKFHGARLFQHCNKNIFLGFLLLLLLLLLSPAW